MKAAISSEIIMISQIYSEFKKTPSNKKFAEEVDEDACPIYVGQCHADASCTENRRIGICHNDETTCTCATCQISETFNEQTKQCERKTCPDIEEVVYH